MNPATEDIKDMLVAEGLGTFQTDLFIADFPDAPDSCTVVSLAPGGEPGLWYEWQRPGIQILVRGSANTYTTANSKIDEIAAFLHGYQNTINSARYALIQQQGDVLYIGKDESTRPIFSANFRIQRTTA